MTIDLKAGVYSVTGLGDCDSRMNCELIVFGQSHLNEDGQSGNFSFVSGRK